MTHETDPEISFQFSFFAWRVSGMSRIQGTKAHISSFNSFLEKLFHCLTMNTCDGNFLTPLVLSSFRMCRSGWTWSSMKTASSTSWAVMDSSRSRIIFSCWPFCRVSISFVHFNWKFTGNVRGCQALQFSKELFMKFHHRLNPFSSFKVDYSKANLTYKPTPYNRRVWTVCAISPLHRSFRM